MRTSRLEGPAVMGTALQLAIEPARFFEFEAGGDGRTLGSLIWAMNAMRRPAGNSAPKDVLCAGGQRACGQSRA